MQLQCQIELEAWVTYAQLLPKKIDSNKNGSCRADETRNISTAESPVRWL